MIVTQTTHFSLILIFGRTTNPYFETFEGTYNFNGRKGKMWLDVQYFGFFGPFRARDEESHFVLHLIVTCQFMY